MRRLAISVVLFVPLMLVQKGLACDQTGFTRDGINMTAAMINPTTPVTNQIINATGCNIGIYIDNVDATIDTVDISGANYFGIVVNGDAGSPSASIVNNHIHAIGESPQNGSQHGVGIYFRAMNVVGSASGTVSNHRVQDYQKNGT